MVYFGVDRPRRVIVWLLSLYTLLVGVVIYLILATSDPCQAGHCESLLGILGWVD